MRRRLVRLTQLSAAGILAAAVAPWLGVAVANADASQTPPPGDIRATSYAGNVTTCAQLGLGTDAQVDDGNLGASGFSVSVDAAKQNLSVSAIPSGQEIDAFVVKGGDGYNVYGTSAFASLPAEGLHAPLVGNPPDNVPTISHWFLCTGPVSETPRPVVVSPTADVAGTCTGATLTLHAGSSNTDFVVSRAGDATGQTTSVAANTSQQVSVTLDAQHPSVSVSVGTTTLGSFTREASCDSSHSDGSGTDTGGSGTGGTAVGGTTTPSGEAAPTVDASNACATGISVELGDMNGTAPVTFTVTKPDGTSEDVDVRVGQIVKRSYAVADQTTGVVTVSAPGLDQTTFSYPKDCTQVLGEKVTKTVKGVKQPRGSKTPATAVQGQKVAQLPFTGFPAGRALTLGALLTAAGVVLTIAPRRRYAPRHAAR